MPSPEPAVACRGLVRRFGERAAVDGLDLELASGQTLLVTGPNGAGKTTLLRVLATALRPTAGELRVAGRTLPGEARAARRMIGYAGHDPLVYGGLTASENLELYAELFGLDRRTAVPRALDRVGLRARADDLARDYSRGMLQRLSLARATLHDPALLLLDEPTSGLDAEGLGVLDAVIAQPGRTLVIATHDPDRFAGAERTLRLDRGREAA
jgi:heme exporter protein A